VKGNKMTENEKSKDELLNPNFGLNTNNPDVKGFLEWLYNPDVDKAYEQFIKESEQDEN
jgi:hypothetical protein